MLPRRGLTKAVRESISGLVFVLPATILLVIFFAVPLVTSGVMSFFNWPIFGEPEPNGVSNYVRALQDPIVLNSIAFTLFYTVLVTALTLVLSFGLAVLVQRGGRAIGLFRTAIFLPSAIGLGLAGLLWGFLYNAQVGIFSALGQWLGLADGPILFFDTQGSALASVVVMVLWKSLGLSMLVMLVGLQGIPTELYEAARIDGASGGQQLTQITLPLMRPTFALLLVLNLSGALLSFDQFFTMTAGGPDQSTLTIVFAIYRAAFTQLQLGYAAALGVLLMALVVLVNLIQLAVVRGRNR